MSKKQITTRGIVFLKRYGMKLIFLPVMVVLIVPRAGFTQESKPVTSWKDIVIGKTTEDEIISRNPEGSVEISFRGWSKIKQGQNGLHRLEFVTECSYAEDKNKIDKFTSQMVKNGIDKDTADFLTGQTDQKSYFQKSMGYTPEEKKTPYRTDVQKLDDCLKPELLNSGPISLKWDKLERAGLRILSDGVILGWTMEYWLGNSNVSLVSKNEILALLESEFGSPGKKVHSDKKTETYKFLIGSRTIDVWLIYLDDGHIRYVSVEERTGTLTQSMQEEMASVILYIMRKME